LLLLFFHYKGHEETLAELGATLYIPEFNRIEDRAVTVGFMKANPFAILISQSERGLVATHLPLLVNEHEGRIKIRGHFAKANHHWSVIEEQESLVIFHGPHAYISPSLYEVQESVPTWNYATVHVYGKGRLLKESADVTQVLVDLTGTFDPSYYERWETFSQEYRDSMVRRIVAFEIEATRIESKFKLSQNRTNTEQQNVIEALERSPDSAVAGVAALMRQQKLGNS
jgi:transcriptional regulator